MSARLPWRWAIPAFAVLLVVVVASVFAGGAWGVRSAGSAARLRIPSVETVHLDARTYMASYAVDHDSTNTGAAVHVPDLHVEIASLDTGEPLPLRRPTKRYVSSAGDETVVDQYEIDVPNGGDYRVSTTASEEIDGHLLIGDRPINALHRVFTTWLLLTVIGTFVAIGVGLRRLAKHGPTL